LARIAKVIVDDELIDGDEICLSANPIHDDDKLNAVQFTSICSFSPPHFCQLCDPLTDCLEIQRRGRHRTIGPVDSFLPFLRWPSSGNPVESIAAVFGFPKNTLHARVLKVLSRVHDPLIGRFITAQACAPLLRHDEYLTYGFIVGETVQNSRRRPGPFQEVKRDFSGKHNCNCLKSEVITNRDGLAVHIVTGVARATHDLRLFRENLVPVVELVASHPREPTDVLADKGCFPDAGHTAQRPAWSAPWPAGAA
jgi:hypothetical protein